MLPEETISVLKREINDKLKSIIAVTREAYEARKREKIELVKEIAEKVLGISNPDIEWLKTYNGVARFVTGISGDLKANLELLIGTDIIRDIKIWLIIETKKFDKFMDTVRPEYEKIINILREVIKLPITYTYLYNDLTVKALVYEDVINDIPLSAYLYFVFKLNKPSQR